MASLIEKIICSSIWGIFQPSILPFAKKTVVLDPFVFSLSVLLNNCEIPLKNLIRFLFGNILRLCFIGKDFILLSKYVILLMYARSISLRLIKQKIAQEIAFSNKPLINVCK